MSDQNKAVVRRLAEEVIQRGNLGLLPELFSPEYVPHDPSNPDRGGKLDGVRKFVELLHSAFSVTRYVVEDMIAEGDKVVYRWSLQGTHTGVLMGVPATGRTVETTGIDIFRLEKGKIVESWVNVDALGMLRQLGVLPASSASLVPPSGGAASSAPGSRSPASDIPSTKRI